MSGLGACVIASLMFVKAPIPHEPPPNPLARGYMGIEVQRDSLMIERIEPGEAADKAGLKPRDVIIRVGTLTPREFSEVIAHVCSFRPGVELEIEVERGNERKLIKVKLGTRPLRLDYPDHVPDVDQ